MKKQAKIAFWNHILEFITINTMKIYVQLAIVCSLCLYKKVSNKTKLSDIIDLSGKLYLYVV